MAGAATLQDASAALEAYLQRCCDNQGGEGAGRVPQAWDDKLQAVRTAVAAAAAGGTPGAAALAREAPPQYQRSLAQRFMEGGGNHVAYLPLGMGMQAVVEEIVRQTLQERPDKHAVLVVDRPAQALGAAARLRRTLGTRVAVFCGGDFLYSFPSEFASARVLVFTAGLLLRLVKMGTYSLGRASLLVLLDAFAVIRNHPMNTLIREYYWKLDEALERPRLLGVLSPQLHSKPRPFDKIRQHVRKLQHSMHAVLLLPGVAAAAGPAGAAGQAAEGAAPNSAAEASTADTAAAEPAGPAQEPSAPLQPTSSRGSAAGRAAVSAAAAGAGSASLAEVEGGLHQHPIMLHAYLPWRSEAQLAGVLQQHCLSLWDVLHEFNLNHFGRLLHFVAPGAAAPDAASEASTPAAGSSVAGEPPAQHGSSAASVGGAGESTGGAGPAADPMHHDWALVETMLRQSIWHTDMLPASGEHGRDPEALALMMHVLECVQALRALFELGSAACLRLLQPPLLSLHDLLTDGPPSLPPSRLRARISEVTAQSKLLSWARSSLPHATPSGGAGAASAQARAPASGSVTPEDGAATPEEGCSPLQPANGAASLAAAATGGGGYGSGPAGSRSALLLQLLRDLREEAQQAQRGEERAQHGEEHAQHGDQQQAQQADGQEGAEAEHNGPTPGPGSSAAGEEPAPQQPPARPVLVAVVTASRASAAALLTFLASSPPMRDVPISVGPGGAADAPGDCCLRVVLLPRDELGSREAAELLRGCSRLVWYSSDDVFHAASHDCDSAAFTTCHALCLAREALRSAGGRDGGGGGKDGSAGSSGETSRLECHVLASQEQVAAHQEALKADQTLKAALQLVHLGDTAFEDRLAALAGGQPAEEVEGGESLEAEAANVLEVVCLGLCGEPPSYSLTLAQPTEPPTSPPESSAASRAEGEAGEVAAPATPPPAAALRFRATVSLPRAHFPSQRFHPQPASMPSRPLRGRPQGCQADACNAAALRALGVLHELGILARYWPTRLLLAQSLLPKGGAGLLEGVGGELSFFLPGAVPLSQPSAHSCPLCSVATTGHRAFGVHLRGLAHQRRLQQAQALGQELPEWLTALDLQAQHHADGQESSDEGDDALGDLKGRASPSEAEMYSPVPTPFHCPTCDVYCTSGQLLEAHLRGRKHQRRAAGLDSPTKAGLQTGRGQPLVTPYYCSLCGMYATSEDQLRMHCLGKRHSRNVQQQRAAAAAAAAGRGGAAAPGARGPLGGGRSGGGGSLPPRFPLGPGQMAEQYGYPPRGIMMQQGGMPYYGAPGGMPLAGMHGMAAGGWPGGMLGGQGMPGMPFAQHSPPPLHGGMGPLPQYGAGREASGMAAAAAAAAGGSFMATSPFHGSPHASGSPLAAGAGLGPAGMGPQPLGLSPGGPFGGAAAAALPPGLAGFGGVLPEGGRVYRCDLCGVVTPSKRHYDYHLQGAKHLRRQARQLGPGGSAPDTPSYQGSPTAGPDGRGLSPLKGRSPLVHGGSAAGGEGGSGPAAGEGQQEGEGQLICGVCGIMATSQLNLEDHYKGRRHQKNLERLQRLQAQALAPQVQVAHAALLAAGGVGSLDKQPSLQKLPSLQKMPSLTGHPSEGSLGRLPSVTRMPSGNVYDNFPCVRVGDVILPSSMDLRAYLDELQHLEAWDPSQESSLPAIDEHSAAEDQHLPPVSSAGLGGGSSSLGASGNGGGGSRGDWGGGGPSSSSAGEGPGPVAPAGGLQRALAGPFSNHSAEDFSAAVAESLAQQSAAGSAPASWQGSRPASEQGDLPIAPAVSLGAAAQQQQQQQHASQPSTPTMGRSQQQLQHGYPPSPSFGGGSGMRGRNGSSTPRAQQAQQQQFWRGNGAGGGGMEAGLPGSPMHPGLFSTSGMGQMGQMSPGQASYGVVPIPHMIPMLHPMQMQYPGSGYGMQYPGGGMAVPMQYPHAMQAPVQMQPQLVAQPGGGWVHMQHAYYAGDMAGAQMQQQQQQQPQQGRGRGGL